MSLYRDMPRVMSLYSSTVIPYSESNTQRSFPPINVTRLHTCLESCLYIALQSFHTVNQVPSGLFPNNSVTSTYMRLVYAHISLASIYTMHVSV